MSAMNALSIKRLLGMPLTFTFTDFNQITDVTPGTGAASKALVLNSGSGITTGVTLFTATTLAGTTGTITTVNSTTLNGTTINAGADAVAGTVNVFPVTTATGKLILAAVSSGGAFNTTISNASQGQSTVVSIPDSGASTSNFVLSKGTQTLAGAYTFTTGGLTITDVNIALSTGTGTKIGTAANQKLGFFNAAPVVQQATTATVTGYTSVGGSAVLSQSTFTGNSGSTAYTIGDIILALKNLGFLAA